MSEENSNEATPGATAIGTAPAENGADSVRRRFQQLARLWKEETEFISSVTDLAMHPAYQRIIGMGRDALPLLLEELKRKPDHWFWALQAITGQNPVAPADSGDVAKMANAWLRWGEQQGL